MTIKVTKPEINIREKLNDLDFDKVPFQKMPAGSVLQVVSLDFDSSGGGTRGAYATTTYVPTSISLSISPSSKASKILMFYNLSSFIGGSGSYIYFKVYKSVNGGDFTSVEQSESASGQLWMSTGGMGLDSPNTTDSIEYKIYVRGNTTDILYVGWSSAYLTPNTNMHSFTLMEIA
jgi:hypothetical protein